MPVPQSAKVASENRLQASPPPEALNEISNFTLKVCTPLYWHDRRTPFPKEMRGGSCFILRFGERLVGVTAAHVLQIYLDDRKKNPAIVCQLRLIEFALHGAVIDHDLNLDIATFAVSENQLKEINGTAIDCTGQWPPPPPERMRAVSLAGFPENLRVTHADRSGVFSAYGGLAAIEDFSERDILLTFDPAREQTLGGLPLPPLGLNMSGCSGGAALMHGERNGLHRWFPVGIMIAGPNRDRGDERGDAETFDMIRVRRIHFLRQDGTIDRPKSGWLPL
jgi:hypothetical protein